MAKNLGDSLGVASISVLLNDSQFTTQDECQCNALVAISKWVVPGKAIAVCGSKFKVITFTPVARFLAGAGQGRVQQGSVT